MRICADYPHLGMLESMETPIKQYACGNIDCGAVFVYGALECGEFREPKFCPDCGQPFVRAKCEVKCFSSSAD